MLHCGLFAGLTRKALWNLFIVHTLGLTGKHKRGSTFTPCSPYLVAFISPGNQNHNKVCINGLSSPFQSVSFQIITHLDIKETNKQSALHESTPQSASLTQSCLLLNDSGLWVERLSVVLKCLQGALATQVYDPKVLEDHVILLSYSLLKECLHTSLPGVFT